MPPSLLYDALIAYAVIGLVVAVALVLVGVGRIDPAARIAIAFRPLLPRCSGHW